MKNYSWWLAVVSIVVLSTLFVSAAQPPVQTSVDVVANTLDIIYPKNPAFKRGETVKLHFHIFNSTGTPLLGLNATCQIHVYSELNAHMNETTLLEDSNGVDQYFLLDPTLTDKVGEFPYIVWCNSTNYGGQNGFISTAYVITNDGLVHDDTDSYTGISIVLVGFLIGLLILVNRINIRDDAGKPINLNLFLIMILYGLIMLVLFLMIQLGYAYVLENTLSDTIETPIRTIYMFVTTVFSVFGLVFLVGKFWYKIVDFYNNLVKEVRK